MEEEFGSEQCVVVCYYGGYAIANDDDFGVVLYWGGDEGGSVVCATVARGGLSDFWGEGGWNVLKIVNFL